MAVSRSVVITGWGVVCPLGLNLAQSWEALKVGRGAGGQLTGPEWEKLKSPRVAQAPAFTPLPGTEGRDRSIQLAALAAQEAWAQAGLKTPPPGKAGTTFSSSKGGLLSLLKAREALILGQAPLDRFLEEFFPQAPGRYLSARLGLGGDPAVSFAGACATGLASLAQAAGWIETGDCEIVLAGSTESCLHPLMWAGFEQMGLLTRNAEGARPFDLNRDGFLLGEGAGALVLEAETTAQARGARPLVRMTGWALGADGEGILEIDPQGKSIITVIQRALTRAGLQPRDINYINAHGTGTRANDKVETRALAEVFGDHPVWVSSTKGATGHLLGAAGSVEAVFAGEALRQGWAPATRNLESPDPDCRARHVPPGGVTGDWTHVLSLSYGIGGQLGAVIFSKG